VYDFKPFYLEAISLTRVLAVMTLDGSMEEKAFQIFVEKCLIPQLWSGAVVVMDTAFCDSMRYNNSNEKTNL
jgi:hypothetical protein